MRIVIVGCGGIACQAAHVLSTIIASIVTKSDRVDLIDPDKIEPKNWKRQWPQAASGAYKTDAMRFAIARADVLLKYNQWPNKFEEISDALFSSMDPREETLFFVWPDNNPCRDAVMEAIEKHGQQAVLVTAGNDRHTAQSMAAVYDHKGAKWEWDFRDDHPEVDFTVETAEGPSCDAQTAMSNLAAALLSFELFEYLWDWADGDDRVEMYWELRDGTPRSYTRLLDTKPAPTEDDIAVTSDMEEDETCLPSV